MLINTSCGLQAVQVALLVGLRLTLVPAAATRGAAGLDPCVGLGQQHVLAVHVSALVQYMYNRESLSHAGLVQTGAHLAKASSLLLVQLLV
jgi:hypothetical protein